MLACLSAPSSLLSFSLLSFSSLALIYVLQEIAERSVNGSFYFRWVGAVYMDGAGAILVHFNSMVL